MVSRYSLRYSGITFLLWLMPSFAHAQATGIHQTISWAVTWAISALNLGIWIVFTLLMQLLDTSMFLGDDMIGILNEVWILSRNLVNIAFAIILIGTAVYTIVTNNKELIAEHMKKFVLAIILVNFSWFIPRVIIDVANVTAATIFDIPSMIDVAGTACEYRSPTIVKLYPDLPQNTCSEILPSTDPPQYRCPCAAVIDAKFFLSDEEARNLKSEDGWNPILAETMYIRLTALSSIGDAAPSSTILNGLIINHARLMGLASVPPSVKNDEISSLIMFLMKEAIVLLLHVALFFPLAAMMLAFIIRIPILWLTIAFMPFMVLQFVVPEKFTEGYPQKIWDHFLKAAFLPAIVAIPLTVGFIMVNAAQKAGILDNLRTVEFPLTGNISDFQEMLWLIMTIGILWVGVFSTLEKMGIMAMGSQAIKGAGEGLGKFAIKTPLSIPFIPLPGGGTTSLLNAGRTVKNVGQLDNPSELIASLRNGGIGPKAASAAKPFIDDAAKMDALNESVQKLTDAMNTKDVTQQQAGVQKFQTDTGLTINSKDPVNSLRPILQAIENDGSADKGKISLLKTRLDELEKAPKIP